MADNDNHPDDADPGAQPESEPTPERSRRDSSDGQGQERARDGDAEGEQSASSEADTDNPEDEAADSDGKSSGFRGIRLRELSGPQACLTIVGCGTLAALLVVGAVAGMLSLIFSSDEDDSTNNDAPDPEWEAAETMPEGALDLCSTLETSGETGDFSSMGPSRVEGSDNYEDSTDESGVRIVRDDCNWEFAANEWDFTLSYLAYASAENGPSVDEMASQEYDARTTRIANNLESVIDASGVLESGDESEVLYGFIDEESQVVNYVFLGRTRSGVFEISIEAESVDTQKMESEARGLVRGLTPVLETRFERVLPR